MLTLCQIKKIARDFNLVLHNYDTDINLAITHPLFYPQVELTVFYFRQKNNLFYTSSIPFTNILQYSYYTVEHVYFKNINVSYKDIYGFLSFFMEDIKMTFQRTLINKKLSALKEDFV